MTKNTSCVIIGGGPSASNIDLESIPDSYDVIGVNRSGLEVERCDFVFSADLFWVHRNLKLLKNNKNIFAVPHLHHYQGSNPEHLDIPVPYRYVNRKPGVGVSGDSSYVYFGDNSGFAALNFANTLYDYVILVGFDLQETGGHWHGGYGRLSIAEKNKSLYTKWARSFDRIADDLSATVVNTSLDSAISQIPYASFEDAI